MLITRHCRTTSLREDLMADETEAGCARPTGGPVGAESTQNDKPAKPTREERAMVMVGQKAPDFIAPGYQKGKFITVKLSDYLGKWIVLCFYPGDFTFV